MTTTLTFPRERSPITEAISRAFDALLYPLGRSPIARKLGLGDIQVIDSFQTTAGAVTVATIGGKDQEVERKTTVKLLRKYAEHSTHVRTALNLYRDSVGRATPIIVPLDPKRRMNKEVEAKLKKLFEEPNEMRDTYAQIREKAVEDYLVVGHYPVEFRINNGVEPVAMYTMDAAFLGFIKDWDGNPRKPRYVEMLPNGRVKRPIPDQMAMVIVNMARSHSTLGLSHVEVLDQAVKALLASDEFLWKQVSQPAPRGALDLGDGVNQPMVEQVRRAITDSDNPFVVLGGTNGAKFIPFFATEDQMKVLDAQVSFIREVASIFQLPMSMFAQNLEMSRANTDSLLANKQEGMGALLWRIQEAENANIAKKFGPVAEHNCYITYSAFNYKDQAQQAEVTAAQIAGQPYISFNEARESAGKERLKIPAADEIWIPGLAMNGMPVSLTMLDMLMTKVQSGEIEHGAATRAGRTGRAGRREA